MPDKIFFSYARSDSDFALGLARDLRAASIDIWVDQLDIQPGATWDRAVEDALQECTGLLVVLTPNAVDSRSVMDEVSYALEENKWVIPVIYRECKLPFRLKRVQHTDFTGDYNGGLSRLIQVLGGTPPTSGTEHPDRPEETSAGSDNGDDSIPESAQPLDTTPHHPEEASGPSNRSSESPPFATAKEHRDDTEHPSDNSYAPRDRIQGLESPSPGLSERKPSGHPRLVTALILGVGGALLAAAGLTNIEDPASSVPIFVLLAGLVWAVAGAIAGPIRVRLELVLATSFVAFLAGIIVLHGRWLAEILVILCPVGALLGAVIGIAVARVRAAER